jgi:enoyl-CoA hydratase/carnithine racemase
MAFVRGFGRSESAEDRQGGNENITRMANSKGTIFAMSGIPLAGGWGKAQNCDIRPD